MAESGSKVMAIDSLNLADIHHSTVLSRLSPKLDSFNRLWRQDTQTFHPNQLTSAIARVISSQRATPTPITIVGDHID